MNWKRNDSLEHEVVDDQMLVFDPNAFKFFELNETMSFIWNLLEKPQSEESIAKAMSLEFEAADDELKKDVSEAMSSLKENALIVEEL